MTGLAILKSRFLAPTAGSVVVLFLMSPAVALAWQNRPTPDKVDLEAIGRRQQELSRRYRELDNKLFSLYRFEQSNDPARAKLLERAFLQSQKNMTADRLATIVAQLQQSRLKLAEDEQDKVLTELESLLELLQSGDPIRQLRDRRERLQALSQRVDRILLLQRGLDRQNEAGQATDRLARSQNQAASETQQAAEEASQLDTDPPPSEPAPAGNTESGAPDPQGPSLPQRLQQAQERMRQAAQQLQSNKRDDAGQEMRRAIEELEAAKRELRNILNQMREEEITQTLEQLENRFRRVLQLQIRINQSTQDLNRRGPERRGADFQVQAGRLAADELALGQEMSQARLLLEEDGTSVAIPTIVAEVERDMNQVAQRLQVARINQVSLALQEDIVASLNLLIESIEQAQQDQLSGQQQSGNPSSQANSEQPLVDQIAELKMLRGLQQRIHARHERYPEFSPEMSAPSGIATDPDLVQALQRLAQRQRELSRLTRGLLEETRQ